MENYIKTINNKTLTITHDHVFAYILAAYSRNTIAESDFKNRAKLAIEKIKQLKLPNIHPDLSKEQLGLLNDSPCENYDNFIGTALENDLVSLENGRIYRNKKKFGRPYKFHKFRATQKDNTVEMLKNEIKPLKKLVKMMRSIMLIPAPLIRRKLRNEFIERDLELFKKDYQQFYIPEESKPVEIGKPFLLAPFSFPFPFPFPFPAAAAGTPRKKGIILVHGYMAAPEEIKPLADFLLKKGYAVYGVRLRGHGTSPEDLAQRSWEEWNESVNRGYVVMKNFVKEMAVIGFSTGSGLALLQAAQKGDKLKGVISINAPLILQDKKSYLSAPIDMVNRLLEKVNLQSAQMPFVPNHPENGHINYVRNPVAGVVQLRKLMTIVEKDLKKITIPSLVLQATGDPVVNPKSAKIIFDNIAAQYKEVFFIDSNRHGILRGDESKQLFDKILAFLEEIFH